MGRKAHGGISKFNLLHSKWPCLELLVHYTTVTFDQFILAVTYACLLSDREEHGFILAGETHIARTCCKHPYLAATPEFLVEFLNPWFCWQHAAMHASNCMAEPGWNTDPALANAAFPIDLQNAISEHELRLLEALGKRVFGEGGQLML